MLVFFKHAIYNSICFFVPLIVQSQIKLGSQTMLKQNTNKIVHISSYGCTWEV